MSQRTHSQSISVAAVIATLTLSACITLPKTDEQSAARATVANAMASKSSSTKPASKSSQEQPATTTTEGAANGTAAGATPGASTPAEPDRSMTPEAFLQEVAKSDLFQISLGTLAVQYADNPEVKDFGRRMVANHTAIDVIIGKIAKAQGVVLPKALDPEDQALVAKFSALRGTEFCKAYMMLMSERTPETLAIYRWQYENCTNDAVKPFATGTTPIAATHARLATALNAEVNKEELRIAAEQKLEAKRQEEKLRAEEAAKAAAAAARRPPTRNVRKPQANQP